MDHLKFDRTAIEEIFARKSQDPVHQELWLSYTYRRNDGMELDLSFSLWEGTFSLSLRTGCLYLSSIYCSELRAIRVLSTAKNQLEIIFGPKERLYRIYLSLDESPISIEEFDGEVIDDFI